MRPSLLTQDSMYGGDGTVYKLSDRAVAKLYWDFDKKPFGQFTKDSKKAEIELRNQTILHENKVMVPKPYGIFNITSPNQNRGSREEFPAFVMELIPGINPHPLLFNEEQLEEIDELTDREVEKARKLGLKLTDLGGWHNSLWRPDTKEVYLIDFAR